MWRDSRRCIPGLGQRSLPTGRLLFSLRDFDHVREQSLPAKFADSGVPITPDLEALRTQLSDNRTSLAVELNDTHRFRFRVEGIKDCVCVRGKNHWVIMGDAFEEPSGPRE